MSRLGFWVAGDCRALGKEPASVSSGGGFPAWSDCVGDSCDPFFHLGQDVWCMYCGVSPLPPRGPRLLMVLNTLPGAAHHHPETSLWVFSFLEDLCAYIGVEHLPALKKKKNKKRRLRASLCIAFSTVRVALTYLPPLSLVLLS